MYYSKAMSKALFGRAVTPPNAKGILKGDSDISNYTADDFLKYWKAKAREKGVTYVTVKYQDKAILKSLLKNFTCQDIKTMIDYLWDSGEPINLKEGPLQFTSYGLFLLSKNWLNSIYNKAMWWKQGYKPTTRNTVTTSKPRGWENTEKEESVEIDF